MPLTNWNDWQHYQDTSRNQAQYGTWDKAANAFIGGPVGWYKNASGDAGLGGTLGVRYAHSVQGDDYWRGQDPNTRAREEAGSLDEATFNSMTDDEMNAFENMDYGKRVAFLKKKRAAMQASTQKTPEQMEQEKQANWQREQEGKLQAFADEMGMSVDELVKRGDIGINKVSDSAANTAQSAAYDRGLGSGGVSSMNTQRAMTDAMQNYALQRQTLGNQARQQLTSQVENTRRYEQGIDMQLQQAQGAAQQQAYQQALAKSGQTLGMVGAAFGTYLGGPAGGQAGYQLGSGLGQQQYQNGNPYTPYAYKYPSGTRKTNTGNFGAQ